MPVPRQPSPWRLDRSRREGECFFALVSASLLNDCAYSVVDFLRTPALDHVDYLERAPGLPVLTMYVAFCLLCYRFMMIKGKPCKILSISVSKTGKHGHAKCNFLAVDIFTGKKLEDMIPSSHGTTVPVVTRNDWEIIDIEGEELTLMDEGGTQKTDLNLPGYPDDMAEAIRDAWSGGDNSVIVTVQAAVGIEQVVAWKKENPA
jgi:translation initiation factor 5A